MDKEKVQRGRKLSRQSRYSKYHTVFSQAGLLCRNTGEVGVGLFLALVLGRMYEEAEMLILCCLHDNSGFIQLGKAREVGNGRGEGFGKSGLRNN